MGGYWTHKAPGVMIYPPLNGEVAYRDKAVRAVLAVDAAVLLFMSRVDAEPMELFRRRR